MTTVGIIQPNFLPWRGYFDFIDEVDVFIFLDDVQYTKGDWRNRNRIRTLNGGTAWLTVPVHASRGDLIRDVRICEHGDWRKRHSGLLRQNYARAPHVDAVLAMLLESYDRHALLSDLNIELCQRVMTWLGIETRVMRSTDLAAPGSKDEKLIRLVSMVGGTRYLSGPAAKAYITPELWSAAGIELAFKDYTGYPEYPQIADPFDPSVSIVDLLCMTGPRARQYMRRTD